MARFHLTQKLGNLLFSVFRQKPENSDVRTLVERIVALPKVLADDHKIKIRAIIYTQIKIIFIKQSLNPCKNFGADGFPGEDLRDFIRQVTMLRTMPAKTSSAEKGEESTQSDKLLAIMKPQMKSKDIIARNTKLLEKFKNSLE